ncbi:TonB-dependent receptor [Psychrosphaera haliotis]|uniref:TonB-dependent receptor n=1 Tax=Psychrosphaera haliotis TaxID=555083 RepID=A0A6N8F959_9GAMM|nr:TonB-dependent receptor [Psychrosphaera haliotis]MUH72963.1 TonB-dependent receptor [Psychrosphaera haliotis]
MLRNSKIAIAVQIALLSSVVQAKDTKLEKSDKVDSGLERITVTSNKRIQSIQDIPTSILAFSGETLEENNISNLLDMSESLPNVHIAETSSSKRIVIRGIGSGTNAGFEQSVAMYKDGIYLGRGHQAKFPLLDMQRVELIKGPQAIMFGKNAIGGAISMITHSPTDEFEGAVNLGLGSENERRLSAILNLPLTSDVALRFAAFSHQDDGYLYNQARDEDEVSNNSKGFKLAAKWAINDELSSEFRFESGNFESKGSRYQYIVDTENRDAQIADAPANPNNVGYRSFLLSDMGGLDYVSSVSGSQHPEGLDERNDTDMSNASLQFTYVKSGYEFQSITTFSEYDWSAVFDADYSEVSLIKQTYIEDFEQFSQEFRVSSPLGETLEYVAGVYFASNELTHPNDVLLGASILIPTLPGTSIGTNALFEQEQTSYSGFASLGWNFDNNWKATFGLRYQNEEKEVSSEQGVYALFEANTPIEVQGFATAAAPLLATSLAGSGQHKFETSRSESHLSPSLSLEYRGFQDTMMFASVSQGVKAGGFDGSGLNSSMGNSPDAESGFEYDEEEATNFEFGIKSQVIKNKLELNATIFNTNYENLQVSEFNGNAFIVKNAAEATAKGIEIDSRWHISDAFEFQMSVALLDFKYDKYEGASPTVKQAELLGLDTQNLSGQTGAYAPDYSGNLTLNHHTTVMGNYQLKTSLSVAFTDDFYLEQDLDPIAVQKSYQKINARIELTHPNDLFSIALFAKNISDEQTYSLANDVPVISYAHRFLVEPPRSIHLQASYRF